jgi:hypothetical protein
LQIARHDLSVADTERGYRLLNVDHTTIHLGRTRVGWTGRWRCRLRYARGFLPLHDRARIRAAHWLRYFKSLGVDLISPGEVLSDIALRIHIRSTTVRSRACARGFDLCFAGYSSGLAISSRSARLRILASSATRAGSRRIASSYCCKASSLRPWAMKISARNM